MFPLKRAQRFDAPTITDQVVRVMAEQQTTLVILDEVHNLRTNRAAGAEAASQLKVFTERVDAAFVYCGIDLLKSDLINGDIGKQIRARTKTYALEPYSFGSEQAREEWLELVLDMEDLLPLSNHPEGLLEEEAAYLFHRTGGSIGSLRGLLGDAAIEAILSGRERVDRALRDEIILDEEAVRRTTSKARTAPERLALWRQLGDLHERAFTVPQTVAGNWVIDRPICSRCIPHLEDGIGRLPGIGWVCLKHKRWIGTDGQSDVGNFGEALVAERHWRGTLARRGVVVDSPRVRLAEEAATVGISKALFEERAERVGHHSPGLLVYPETVKIARLLSRPTLLDAVLGDASGRWKRTMVEREVRAILPDPDDAENWRALARVWDLVLGLQDAVRDARWLGQAPEDRWNVLRCWSRLPEFESVQVVQAHQLV